MTVRPGCRLPSRKNQNSAVGSAHHCLYKLLDKRSGKRECLIYSLGSKLLVLDINEKKAQILDLINILPQCQLCHQALTHEAYSQVAPPTCFHIPMERYLHTSRDYHSSIYIYSLSDIVCEELNVIVQHIYYGDPQHIENSLFSE